MRLDANSIPTTMPSEIKVPTSEEAYTNLVSELFPHGAPKLGDVFTIPGSQAPPPSVQVWFAVATKSINSFHLTDLFLQTFLCRSPRHHRHQR